MPKESAKTKKEVFVPKEDFQKKVDMNDKLIENFISLQKVMTNFAVKFDNLSTQISKLLELFEISAKALAEKDYSLGENKEDKKVVEKLDSLLQQNKIIAKGIALLHESNYSQPEPVKQEYFQPSQEQRVAQQNYSKQITKPFSSETNSSNSKVRPLNI
jgi:hypothetical protein